MMRRAMIAFAVTWVSIAFVGGARATHTLLGYQSAVDELFAVDPTIQPAANDSGKDFAVGGFHGVADNNIGFSAHSGPLGESPKGHLNETIPHFFPGGSSGTYHGRFDVTCLAVLGPDAALGLVPRDNASNDQSDEFVFAVRDNGKAGDEYTFYSSPAATCALFVGAAIFMIERGNISVHDGMP